MAQSFLNKSGFPLGLRNNNPGNIRTGDNWIGMIGSNQGFVVFSDIAYGIRAMAIVVGGDIMRGKNTIHAIVYMYAPPSENDTASYVANVVAWSGIPEYQVITTEQQLRQVLRAMMNQELGKSWADLITDQDMTDGLALVNSSVLAYFNIIKPAVFGLGGLLLVGGLGWLISRIIRRGG